MRFVVSADTPILGPSAPRHDRGRERRADVRYSLDEAFGHLNYHGAMIPCRFLDISLGGCRVSTESPFVSGALAPVEIVLLMFGLILRIGGVTQWTRSCEVGIRFTHSSPRSKNQLASLLTCLMEKDAQKAAQEIFSQAALDPETSPTLFPQASPRKPAHAPDNHAPARVPANHAPARVPEGQAERRPIPASPSPAQPHPPAETAPPPAPIGALIATDDEWPTVIRFLSSRTHTQGLITGLNLEACAVKTAEPFPAPLHSPVELSFQVCGLPFQLRGAVAATSGPHGAHIRFHDMSRRKREELQQVLDELSEAAAKGQSESE
jgi:hypothetical protein